MTCLQSRFEHLKQVTKEVSNFCLQGFHDLAGIRVESKGHADYVSDIDRRAEHLARTLIGEEFPHDAIIGEEGGGEESSAYWIIDPVDGTANFLSGLPLWAVSIAYVIDDIPVIGAIALPAMNVLLLGGINQALQHWGNLPPLNQVMPKAFGVGRNSGWSIGQRHELEEALEEHGFNVVSFGSCATSLAFVATGRLAGYVENHIHLWDCAAGYALCVAAGKNCTITQAKGSKYVHVSAGQMLTIR